MSNTCFHYRNGYVMKSSATLVLLYSLFAGLSMAANLVTQAVVASLILGTLGIYLSVIAGTIVGLPIKYLLDKRFIFKFKTQNIAHDSRLFVLYSILAVVTTAIFWGFEALFQIIFGTELLRLTGGAIGLIIGYAVKYQLDKRFVFKTLEVD